METVKKVLTSYAVYPLKIEQITDALYRIEDGNRVYALKRSSLTNKSVANWENVFHQVNAQNITNVLPVYLTKHRKLYEQVNGTVYYLAPWVEGNRQSIERLYHCIGNVHAKTKQSRPIDVQLIEQSFHTYKNQCKEKHKQLLTYVEQFESNTYMSPFELLICTHYRDLELVFLETHKRVDQFIQENNEEAVWNYSLCHGSLKFSHFLNENQTYLINWEKAQYENAIQDLVDFFKYETIVYDASAESFIRPFTTYMDANPLTKQELYLLTVYLLDTTDYITLIENYMENITKHPMVYQIQSLQRVYRQLVFGLHWSDYVENEYESISLDDLDDLET